jgi:hypothetical protein
MCVCWNSLPLDIRKLTTVDLFKIELKTHLFRRAFEINDEDNAQGSMDLSGVAKQFSKIVAKLKYLQKIVKLSDF